MFALARAYLAPQPHLGFTPRGLSFFEGGEAANDVTFSSRDNDRPKPTPVMHNSSVACIGSGAAPRAIANVHGVSGGTEIEALIVERVAVHVVALDLAISETEKLTMHQDGAIFPASPYFPRRVENASWRRECVPLVDSQPGVLVVNDGEKPTGKGDAKHGIVISLFAKPVNGEA